MPEWKLSVPYDKRQFQVLLYKYDKQTANDS